MDSSNETDRSTEKIFDQARAMVIWGDDQESVLRFLQERGVEERLAKEVYLRARRERSADIRVMGWRKALMGIATIGSGLLIGCVVNLEWVPDYQLRTGRFTTLHLYSILISLSAAACLFGAWRLVDGVHSAIFAKNL